MTHLPFDINLTYIIGAFLLSLPTWAAIALGRMDKRSDRKRAAEVAMKVEDVREKLESSSASLNTNIEKIHVAVNSERTAMLEKIEEMHTVILGLTEQNMALQEKKL